MTIFQYRIRRNEQTGESVRRTRFLETDSVLDVIEDASDVAPYRQSDTSPVLGRLWLEKLPKKGVAKPIRYYFSQAC